MESFLTHLMHFALWVFFVIFAFAIVGVYATLAWIVRLYRRTTSAVQSGVSSVGHAIHRD